MIMVIIASTPTKAISRLLQINRNQREEELVWNTWVVEFPAIRICKVPAIHRLCKIGGVKLEDF